MCFCRLFRLEPVVKTVIIDQLSKIILGAIIIVLPLLYLPFLNLQYLIPKLELFKFLTISLAIVASAKVLISKKISIKIDRQVLLFVTIFALVFTLSSLLSTIPQVSLYGFYFREEGLLQLAFQLIFFLSLLIVFPKNKAFIINAITISLLLVCLLALLQFKSEIRIYGTLGQPNFLAQYLITTLPLILLHKRKYTPLIVALALIILVFTGSRSAMLGLFVAFVIYSLLKKKKLLIFPAILLALILLLNIFQTSLSLEKSPIFSRFTVNSQSFDSVELRLQIWPMIFQKSLQKPLLGHGPDTMYFNFEAVENHGALEKIDHAHNLLLNDFFHLGLLGVLARILLLFSILILAYKNRHKSDSLAILLSLTALFTSLLFSPPSPIDNINFWLLTAFLIQITGKEVTFKKIYLAVPCLVLIFLISTESPNSNIRADLYYQQGIIELYNNNHPLASDYFLKASHLAPHQLYYAQRGLEHLQQIESVVPEQYKWKLDKRAKEFLTPSSSL